MRALRVLQMADVVIYDAVVPQSIVDLAWREAERICGGSEAEMLKLAREGQRVVHLRVTIAWTRKAKGSRRTASRRACAWSVDVGFTDLVRVLLAALMAAVLSSCIFFSFSVTNAPTIPDCIKGSATKPRP